MTHRSHSQVGKLRQGRRLQSHPPGLPLLSTLGIDPATFPASLGEPPTGAAARTPLQQVPPHLRRIHLPLDTGTKASRSQRGSSVPPGTLTALLHRQFWGQQVPSLPPGRAPGSPCLGVTTWLTPGGNRKLTGVESPPAAPPPLWGQVWKRQVGWMLTLGRLEGSGPPTQVASAAGAPRGLPSPSEPAGTGTRLLDVQPKLLPPVL